MSDEFDDSIDSFDDTTSEAHSDFVPSEEQSNASQLSGMFKDWFLDYSSYVILDRAVPYLSDGLKPVQRRILHAMKCLDDGRFNKVANIVGHTMQYHPHGDASIGEALIQLGQKDLLIDCQGNWGNILTGHHAAAPRYIEARLSKFALETIFNPKTTDWKLSYDGRNQEPITLPAKFPLLLAQGAKGIGVGLSSIILPHNFNEICQAAVSYLKGEEFHLYPDFQTGGQIDISRYNDGERGGQIKVRAKIEKSSDNKTLIITEIPYGETVMTLCDSIAHAGEKGKIKIRKLEDLTSEKAEIRITLAPGVSSDKTIDALYAFTNCEVSISPNCCVIDNQHPHFLNISTVLRKSVDNTRNLLQKELEIQRSELMEKLHFASLEKIFIEERIYKAEQFEQAESTDKACEYIDERLTPYYPQFIREVSKEDILKLLDIKMARILKFNSDKASDYIASLKDEIKKTEKKLSNMTLVTIEWFTYLKNKYGEHYPRRTEFRSFDTIVATKVVEANQKLYINREDGFIGTSLKKDEYVCNCSDIDDVILFYKDGTYKFVKIAEKLFVGQNVIHVDVYKKNDKRTVYNLVYRDGKNGPYYMKRFCATGLVRDKEYNVTLEKPGSKVVYFTANHNGEAEVIKIQLKPNPKLKKQIFDKDFSAISIKGRQSMGNLVTRNDVLRITLKSHGVSTLGGRKVWFDWDVFRLDLDGHGTFLGEFDDNDRLLVILDSGEYYITDTDPANHFDTNIMRIEKFDANKIWTLFYSNGAQKGMLYEKRFAFEPTGKRTNFVSDDKKSYMILLTDTYYPNIRVSMGGADSVRTPLEIDAEAFVSQMGIKAKGKRITNWKVEKVEELEPLRLPPVKTEEPQPEPVEIEDPVLEEDNPQLSLFDSIEYKEQEQ
ncbi:MAG: DNA gyrase/topoisomerase IV subunit A [Bacteroidaceae bacterium]|nr:DNA gyrase/topoisomerase IV subunit A [Bacteroidaceae bacterium]